MRKKPVLLYNILFPVWMLIWVPSFLWLFLIPANYLIDRIVLFLGLGNMPEKREFCQRHTWKICLAGFICDFIGSLFLFLVMMTEELFEGRVFRWVYGISYNPFDNLYSFLVIALAVLISAFSIYRFDRVILEKAGLSKERAGRAAFLLAVLTAPYLFFLPGNLLYR